MKKYSNRGKSKKKRYTLKPSVPKRSFRNSPSIKRSKTSKKSKFSISVNVRVKPILDLKQYKHNSKNNHKIKKKELWHQNIIYLSKKRFHFDNVLIPSINQEQTYDKIMPDLIHSFENGYDCCLIAYGQTGSGKTHTLFSPPGKLTTKSLRDAEGRCPPTWGLFPRTMLVLLDKSNIMNIELKVSVVECYFGAIFDLLNKRKRLNFGINKKKSILPGEHKKYEFFVDRFGQSNRPKIERKKKMRNKSFQFTGHKEVVISTPLEVAKIARLLENTRTSKSTDMNDRSSRSHCVVSVTMMKKNRKNNNLQNTRFVFVDLAGSERIKKSGAVGAKKSEACSVNSSLTSLARTINALSSKKNNYIPYRDSTLTMILKDSFGGNCRTSMMINIAEDAQHGEESLCSLRFGERCAMVENKIRKKKSINVEKTIDSLSSKLRALRKELRRLKSLGFGGGLNTKQFPPHIIEMWKVNKKKLDDAVSNVENYRCQLQELQENKNSMKYQQVTEKLELANKIVFVQNGIIARMMYTKVWTKPAKSYEVKEAEIKDLESKLSSYIGISRK